MKDFQKSLSNELLNAFLFEDAYDVQGGDHFALTKGDVVQADLRPRMSQIANELKPLKNATFGQLDLDENGKVVIKGQAAPAGEQPAAPGAPDAKQHIKQVVHDVKGDLAKKEVIDFIKMLKDNGSLSSLTAVDDATRKEIANAVASIIKKKSISEAEYNLFNEAYEALTGTGFICELDVNGGKAADPATAPAPDAPSLSAANEPKPSYDTMKVGELIKNVPAELKSDPKIAYVQKLQKELDSYSQIQDANVTESPFMAVVTGVENNKVSAKLLIPASRNKDGSIRYKDGSDLVIPMKSVMKRTPASKARGIFGKAVDWVTG